MDMEYPGKTDKPKQEKWLHEGCHQLKYRPNTVEELISEMETFSRKTSLTKSVKENLSAALTYYVNH